MSAESDSARLEILLEALEIFVHDLSNPLQSLIVLTELALDDAAPNSEDELRCRQTLEAAERMRTLVTGLAGLTRDIDGARNTRTAVERSVEVLSRRWERHRIEIAVELGPVQNTPSPPLLDFALLNAGLAAVATAGTQSGSYRLDITGRDLEGGDLPCALLLTLTRRDDNGAVVEVPLDGDHIRRFERLLEGPALRVRTQGNAIRLEFAPGAMR